jgi:uncharacterized membrane protein YheB (UPF0754 family)
LCTSVVSGFFLHWLDEDDTDGFSWISVLKFGTIPLIAAIIGYSTNVVALWMMFWPIEFVGCLPQLKLGPPLDFFLCGYQGVIPMKAQEMAELSYELITTKLMPVSEIFERLDPQMMHSELHAVMPRVVSDVLEQAALKTIPDLWAKMPLWLRRSLVERTTASMASLLSDFFHEMRGNIDYVFDLKHCVVDFLVQNKRITNDMFVEVGKQELEFIKTTGFYLGYIFGVFQMTVWLFLRSWWILPLCGIVVGYATNEFALKAIFIPANPMPVCGGIYKLQGLFLKRQQQVSPIYARKVTRQVMTIENMIREMCYGQKSERLRELVDKHVMICFQEQIGNYKQLLSWSIGPEDLDRFQVAACAEFWKQFPAMLGHTSTYMEEAMALERTLTERMQALPPKDFERLLHAVFEQDEFKLVLVGALLGALVGFLQAMVQEPKQLGISV